MTKKKIVNQRRNTLHSGFTFVELVFVIVVVSVVTVSISQLFLYTTRARTVSTESDRASELATTVMERFISESQNSSSTFWQKMANNAVGASYDTNTGDIYGYVFTQGAGCARDCGSVRIGVTMAAGQKQYVKERFFSSTTSLVITTTPTPIPTNPPPPDPGP